MAKRPRTIIEQLSKVETLKSDPATFARTLVHDVLMEGLGDPFQLPNGQWALAKEVTWPSPADKKSSFDLKLFASEEGAKAYADLCNGAEATHGKEWEIAVDALSRDAQPTGHMEFAIQQGAVEGVE